MEWLDQVVDFWSLIASRCLKYSLSNSYSFKLQKNQDGCVVFRTKDFMHGKTWFPVGKNSEDVSFAPPLLAVREESCATVRFVVPGIVDVNGLQTTVDRFASRLSLPRSKA